jgi:hypothetical protein
MLKNFAGARAGVTNFWIAPVLTDLVIRRAIGEGERLRNKFSS